MMQCEAHGLTNENELRIVGMSRSGNHAIINWITAQIRGRWCFLNCVEPKSNPFQSARPLTHRRPYRVNYSGFDLQHEQQGNLSRKDYLIYNYEDCFLGMVGSNRFEARHDAYVGRSGRRFDVLILRDPFNLFASRKKAGASKVSVSTAARIWKQHAREYLGLRQHLKHERVCINYNRWISDRPYRRQIATQLGLHFTDAHVQTVAACGGGSSFDALRFDGCAGHMDVLTRWRHFMHDPYYRSTFDEKMLQLSEEIFGPIPGTEVLFANTPVLVAA